MTPIDPNHFDTAFSQLARDAGDVLPAPVGSPLQLAEQMQERQAKLKQTVKTLQESLDQLRLSVKYLVFDLEATRRENQYLRKLLDSSEG